MSVLRIQIDSLIQTGIRCKKKRKLITEGNIFKNVLRHKRLQCIFKHFKYSTRKFIKENWTVGYLK